VIGCYDQLSFVFAYPFASVYAVNRDTLTVTECMAVRVGLAVLMALQMSRDE
jgi:hypothetical protein